MLVWVIAGMPQDFADDDPLTALDGIGPARSEDLRSAGYETVGDLTEARLPDLVQIIPADVARNVAEQLDDFGLPNVTSVAEAKQRAREIPGAKAKVVKQDGKQTPKVLEKVAERHEAGATIEVHRG